MGSTTKNYAVITIKVSEEVKKELERIKIIPEETMNNLIRRLIDCYKTTNNADKS